jgi:hypothetical protein
MPRDVSSVLEWSTVLVNLGAYFPAKGENRKNDSDEGCIGISN